MSPALRSGLEWLLAVFSAPVIALIIQGIRYLGAKWHLTMTETQQAQLKHALETAVAAAAERYRAKGLGEVKAQFALEQAIKFAPDAMAKVKPEQQKVLVQATYATLRPSLPTAEEHAAYDIPVDVVDLSARVTPIPPPKRPL